MTVPEEWVSSKIEDSAEVILSNVDKKSKPMEMPVKLCNYMDVYENEAIDQSLCFMTATATTREIEKFKLREGDVLVTKDSETPDDIAKSAVVRQDFENVLCGYHLAILRPRKEKLIGEFLSTFLQTHNSRAYFSSRANGVTRFGLTLDSIRRTPIHRPPPPGPAGESGNPGKL